MAARESIWTYVSITGVTVLIWFWAAGATREQREIRAQLQFQPNDETADWVVQPFQQPVQITIEGSRWSLQKAGELFRTPLTIDLLPEIGPQRRDLIVELAHNSRVRETGVRIVACQPPSLDINIDRRESVKVPIRANLSGLQTVGEIEVDPPEATVTMPSLLRKRLPSQLTLEATVLPAQVRDLGPGVRHTLNSALRLTDVDDDSVTVNPPTAKVSFTIRSRTDETILESVRVQLAGPHQDFDDYDIELPEDTLRNVTVSGEAELIRRIAAGEVRVVALLHLTTNDKERGIRSKRVSTFLAIAPDGSMSPVAARANGSTESPEISVHISKRTRPPAAELPADGTQPGR